jgi:hypothetical protein
MLPPAFQEEKLLVSPRLCPSKERELSDKTACASISGLSMLIPGALLDVDRKLARWHAM